MIAVRLLTVGHLAVAAVLVAAIWLIKECRWHRLNDRPANDPKGWFE